MASEQVASQGMTDDAARRMVTGCRRALTLASLLVAIAGTAARSQTEETAEFWPELNLFYRFDDHNKVIGLASLSRNRDNGATYQGEVGLAFDHRFADFFSGRIGYRHARATDGGDFREDRLLLEQTFRVALPAQVMVDLRTREDFRWLDTGFSMRFRERVLIQRDTTLGGYTFTPYAAAEVFFDTRYDQFSRYRLTVGSTFPVYGPLNVEPYLTRQVDVAPTAKITNVIGLILIATF
jgi:hypothetical protein